MVLRSRNLAEYLTIGMAEAYRKHDLSCLAIPFWDNICNDDDGKTFRNMMKLNKEGLPVHKIKNVDLANFICLVLQHKNPNFAGFVRAWYLDSIDFVDKNE